MEERFNFKKKFGQNFLTDKNLLKSIVAGAEIDGGDTVVEIGAGAGALTEQLSLKAKRVVAFEIDKELMPVLQEKFGQKENVEIIYEDFLNFNEDIFLEKVGTDYKVVANLPYYITSPIITKLLSMKVRPKSLTIMVQQEVGERIVATPESGNYGYFSAFVASFATASIIRYVSRKMFNPVPNVDSCVVHMVVDKGGYIGEFDAYLKKAFQMKRKTLVNNLTKAGIAKKEEILEVLSSLSLEPAVRADAIDAKTHKLIFEKLSCIK